MKKINTMLAIALLAATSAFAASQYSKVTKTGLEASTTITLTNENSIATYEVVDVYIQLASGATDAATVTLTDGTVFVDSATIASNEVGAAVVLADRVMPQAIGDTATVTRDANATNSTWTVVFITKQD